MKYKNLKEKARPLAARIFYPFADAIIAVSDGAANALSRTAGIARDRITVINNPVFTPAIPTLAQDNVEHPWLKNKQFPVIVAVGRLSDAKDYPTLLKAVAHVSAKRMVKCIILGEGELREKLQGMIEQMSLSDTVDLHGFVGNPYAFLAKADLFVLSSRREGFPNVLVEAMACGTPVVATDCPSGPAEILDNGKYGPLVPVGDVQALADAMLRTLDDHLPAETLIARAEEFSVEKIAGQYIDLLFSD
jgi:glycosyltransferase involved in cell wall biosynthesis